MTIYALLWVVGTLLPQESSSSFVAPSNDHLVRQLEAHAWLAPNICHEDTPVALRVFNRTGMRATLLPEFTASHIGYSIHSLTEDAGMIMSPGDYRQSLPGSVRGRQDTIRCIAVDAVAQGGTVFSVVIDEASFELETP